MTLEPAEEDQVVDCHLIPRLAGEPGLRRPLWALDRETAPLDGPTACGRIGAIRAAPGAGRP